MSITLIPQDKANHFIYGVLVGLATVVLASRLGYPAPELAIAAAAVVGIGKEVADYIANVRAKAAVHGVEFMDAVATTLGGVVIYLAMGI